MTWRMAGCIEPIGAIGFDFGWSHYVFRFRGVRASKIVHSCSWRKNEYPDQRNHIKKSYRSEIDCCSQWFDKNQNRKAIPEG